MFRIVFHILFHCSVTSLCCSTRNSWFLAAPRVTEAISSGCCPQTFKNRLLLQKKNIRRLYILPPIKNFLFCSLWCRICWSGMVILHSRAWWNCVFWPKQGCYIASSLLQLERTRNSFHNRPWYIHCNDFEPICIIKAAQCRLYSRLWCRLHFRERKLQKWCKMGVKLAYCTEKSAFVPLFSILCLQSSILDISCLCRYFVCQRMRRTGPK